VAIRARSRTGGRSPGTSGTGDSRDVGAPAKDGLEGCLYDQACHRQTVPLARTQAELATDWYAAWLAARRPDGSTGSPG